MDIVTANCTLYHVCKHSFDFAPYDVIANWCFTSGIDKDAELTESECQNSFTVCECTVDLEQETVHHILDAVGEETSLRTYILLFTVLEENLYVVGVRETYPHLVGKEEGMILTRLKDIQDIRIFLWNLDRQKYQIKWTSPILFNCSEAREFTNLDFTTYKSCLDTRLECLVNSITNLREYGTPVVGSTMEFALYTYSLFAASVSDKLVETLIKTIIHTYQNQLYEFYNIPWLRFQFTLRFLGVDWESIQTHHYRDIFTLELSESYDLLDSAKYCLEHCSTESAYSDFYFKVSASLSPIESPFHCAEHKNDCTKLLTIQRGMHIVPYALLEKCAVRFINRQVLRACNNLRRLYYTRDAFVTWKTEVKSFKEFYWQRRLDETREMENKESVMCLKSVRNWYVRLQNAKSNPALVCDFDASLIEQCVIPFWEEIIFLRYNQSLDARMAPMNYRFRSEVTKYVSQQVLELPANYDEFLVFAERYWSPCMVNLVRMCKTTHLKHKKRIIVCRFLLSEKMEYGVNAARLWELFWVATNKYNSLKFWDDTYGKVFTTFAKADSEKYKHWPSCFAMVEEGLCPIAVDGIGDIEDMTTIVSRKRTACANHLHSNLEKQGKVCLWRDPKIGSPMAYAKGIRASKKK